MCGNKRKSNREFFGFIFPTGRIYYIFRDDYQTTRFPWRLWLVLRNFFQNILEGDKASSLIVTKVMVPILTQDLDLDAAILNCWHFHLWTLNWHFLVNTSWNFLKNFWDVYDDSI